MGVVLPSQPVSLFVEGFWNRIFPNNIPGQCTLNLTIDGQASCIIKLPSMPVSGIWLTMPTFFSITVPYLFANIDTMTLEFSCNPMWPHASNGHLWTRPQGPTKIRQNNHHPHREYGVIGVVFFFALNEEWFSLSFHRQDIGKVPQRSYSLVNYSIPF